MIKISHDSPGFKVVISEPGMGVKGYSVRARNLAEVHAAIDHYYGNWHGPSEDDCPLCRHVAIKPRWRKSR